MGPVQFTESQAWLTCTKKRRKKELIYTPDTITLTWLTAVHVAFLSFNVFSPSGLGLILGGEDGIIRVYEIDGLSSSAEPKVKTSFCHTVVCVCVCVRAWMHVCVRACVCVCVCYDSRCLCLRWEWFFCVMVLFFFLLRLLFYMSVTYLCSFINHMLIFIWT